MDISLPKKAKFRNLRRRGSKGGKTAKLYPPSESALGLWQYKRNDGIVVILPKTGYS
jgi:hypothetical protein